MAESALIEKLRTALAEAERLAREALLTDDQGDDGQWYTVDGLALSHHDGGAGLADFDAEFIAANHPAHVLRTVAAHRKILSIHCRVDARPDWPHTFAQAACYGCGATFDEEYAVDDADDCPVVRALAAVYFPEAPDA